jgi:hypothetical protein
MHTITPCHNMNRYRQTCSATTLLSFFSSFLLDLYQCHPQHTYISTYKLDNMLACVTGRQKLRNTMLQ